MAGGQRVTVEGRGFGSTSEGVRVTVAGEPCTVLEVSPSGDEVVCETAPMDDFDAEAAAASARFFPGGRGVRRDMWRGKKTINFENVEDMDAHGEVGLSDVLESFDTRVEDERIGLSYSQRLRAFYRPPTSGTHRLWINSDDAAAVKVGNPTHITDDGMDLWFNSWDTQFVSAHRPGLADPLMAAYDSPTARVSGSSGSAVKGVDFDYGSKLSRPLELSKNEMYLVEARHQEGRGGDHFRMAAVAPAASRAADAPPPYNAAHEVQRVIFRPRGNQETHRIAFDPPLSTGSYRLKVSSFGADSTPGTTSLISWDENPKDAIKALQLWGSRDVSCVALEPAGSGWEVSFKDMTTLSGETQTLADVGQRPLIEFVDGGARGSSTVTVDRTQEGDAALSGAVLVTHGDDSKAINLAWGAVKVEEALEELLDTPRAAAPRPARRRGRETRLQVGAPPCA